MIMNLTKRQEKQLIKVFDNPKKLRKWVDEVYQDIIIHQMEEVAMPIQQVIAIHLVGFQQDKHIK